MTCQVPSSSVGPQQRRALQLVAHELGPLGGHHQEADERFVRRDPGVPAEDRLAQHGRPFDLEQQGHLAPDVPDRVDLGQRVAGPVHAAEVDPLLAGVEPVDQRTRGCPPRLLRSTDPDPHAEPVPGVGEQRQQLRVLLAAAQQVVAGDQAVRRAGQAAVAVEARPDQAFVGKVVAGEQRGDALVERRLRDRTGRRQEAEDGPFDPIGERRGGGLAVLAARSATSGPARSPPRAVGSGGSAPRESGRAGLRPDPGSRSRADAARRTRAAAAGVSACSGRAAAGAVTSSSAATLGLPSAPGPTAPRRPTPPPSGPGSAGRVAAASRRSCPARSRPDQDLAEHPLVACRLSPGAQGLDRRLGHGPRRVGARERTLVEPLRRGEQAAARDQVRIAGAAGHRIQAHVARGCAGRAAAGRRAAGARRFRQHRRRDRRAAR